MVSIADVVDVDRSNAGLHVGEFARWRGCCTAEVRLQGHHSGIYEKKTRIILSQHRGARNALVRM